MSTIAANIGLMCAPVVGVLTGIAVAEDSTPWIAVIGATVLTGLMIPTVKWMMKRLDVQSAEAAAAQARREKREDDRHEAFQTLVVTLGTISSELRLLNDNHKELDRNRESAVKEILERIDGLPDRIVKKCNG